MFQVNSRLQQLEDALVESATRIDEERMIQASYRHMLDRMNKDFIASRIKSSEQDISLKSKEGILAGELQKHRLTKEEKLQSKNIFD